MIESEHEPTPEEKRENLRKALGVSSLSNTFEVLKPWPGAAKALAAFKALALGKTQWKMLLEYGGVGNGKTHHCEATAIALYKMGLFCGVITMDRVMSLLKNAMTHDKRGNDGKPWVPYDTLFQSFQNRDYLIIDDATGTDWEFEQLEKIIRVRYHECLFTILTTNRDLTELPERIVSRFRDPDIGKVVLNSGEDFRRLKGGLL